MKSRDLIWGCVIVTLGLMACVTTLIITGNDYNGILVLISSAVVVAGQVINLVRTGHVASQVEDVQFKVNGKMSALMRAAGIDPTHDGSETPVVVKLSDGSVAP